MSDAAVFDPRPWEMRSRAWAEVLETLAMAGPTGVCISAESARDLAALLRKAEAPGSSAFNVGRGYDAGRKATGGA